MIVHILGAIRFQREGYLGFWMNLDTKYCPLLPSYSRHFFWGWSIICRERRMHESIFITTVLWELTFLHSMVGRFQVKVGISRTTETLFSLLSWKLLGESFFSIIYVFVQWGSFRQTYVLLTYPVYIFSASASLFCTQISFLSQHLLSPFLFLYTSMNTGAVP